MARRPSFQFYPADWLSNTKLRSCTFEQQGAWVTVMCLMNDSDEYGVLHQPLKQIARAANCKVSILIDLVKNGVLKGADDGAWCSAFTYTPVSGRQKGPTVTLIPGQPGPVWYSSRMVRDEYSRQHKGESSRFRAKEVDEPDTMPSAGCSPSHRQGERQGDGFSSSSSSSSFNPLLRSDSEHLPQADTIVLSLPCQKGKVYFLGQGQLDLWKVAYPGLDPLAEAAKMLDWLQSNPSRTKAFSGMARFTTNWMARAQKDHDEKQAMKASQPHPEEPKEQSA